MDSIGSIPSSECVYCNGSLIEEMIELAAADEGMLLRPRYWGRVSYGIVGIENVKDSYVEYANQINNWVGWVRYRKCSC